MLSALKNLLNAGEKPLSVVPGTFSIAVKLVVAVSLTVWELL